MFQHKSLPYCHNPCYKALFGPSILGYGSNISTPANFARKSLAIDGSDLNNGYIVKTEIFSNQKNHRNTIEVMSSKHAKKPTPNAET